MPAFRTALRLGRWPTVVLTLVALASCDLRNDPTEGLHHRSGDRPKEVAHNPGCAMTGNCPTPGFTWSIPAAGAVETRFDLDGPDGAALHGTMLLTARTGFGGFRACPAVVDWVIAVPGRTITGGTLSAPATLSAGDPTQAVEGSMPPDATVATLTARRTDDESCSATLHWDHASLK